MKGVRFWALLVLALTVIGRGLADLVALAMAYQLSAGALIVGAVHLIVIGLLMLGWYWLGQAQLRALGDAQLEAMRRDDCLGLPDKALRLIEQSPAAARLYRYLTNAYGLHANLVMVTTTRWSPEAPKKKGGEWVPVAGPNARGEFLFVSRARHELFGETISAEEFACCLALLQTLDARIADENNTQIKAVTKRAG